MGHVFLILVIIFTSVAAHSDALATLSPDGLGPLRIGMTQRAAERATGMKLGFNPYSSDDAEACEESNIVGKPGIYLLTEHHRIARVDVGKDAPGISTPEGVRVGTSESQLRRIFGKRAVFSYRPYEGDDRSAHEVTVKLNAHSAFVFETKDYKVEEMRAGHLDAVQLWEGCS